MITSDTNTIDGNKGSSTLFKVNLYLPSDRSSTNLLDDVIMSIIEHETECKKLYEAYSQMAVLVISDSNSFYHYYL